MCHLVRVAEQAVAGNVRHGMDARADSRIERGLRCNALIRDAIAQFLIPQEDWRQGTFRLEGREHLRQVQVATTDVGAYAQLVTGGEGR